MTDQDKAEAIVLNSEAAVADPGGVRTLWNAVKDKMFSLSDREKELGLGERVSLARVCTVAPELLTVW